MYDHLQEQAVRLAGTDAGRPRQADLRRAISASYYAIFHYLVDQSCSVALGRAPASLPYRRVLGRSFDHTAMKIACQSFAGGNLKESVTRGLPTGFSVDPPTRYLAATFLQLQELRHAADYDLSRRFSRSECKSAIDSVTLAIRLFDGGTNSDQRKFFLCCLWAYAHLINRR